MNHRIFILALAPLIAPGCTTTNQYDGPGPFDKSADARSQVTNAIVEAHEFDRNVLLVFGANWCSDSRATLRLFNTDPAISNRLKESFVVEKIDVGPQGVARNTELVAQYHVTIDKGIPVLVVLSSSGNLLNDTRVERLSDEVHNHPERILEFLERYAPLPKASP